MKKLFSLLLCAAMALSMTASPVRADDVISTRWGDLPADGPEIGLVIASDAVETSVHSQAVYKLADDLAAETQGKITLTYYPNAQLGADMEILNSTVAGDIDMDIFSAALAQSIVPESCMFNIPFMNDINDLDAIIKTMIDSDFRTALNECYEKAGLKLMVLSLGQSWELSTCKKITTLEELQGLKIRTPQGDSYMAIWAALGANPTPLAYSELYTSLQQGLVDGHDNMLSNVVSVKFYEQAPYIMMTNHNFGAFTIVMNKGNFEALDPAYQAVLKAACDETSDALSRAFQDAQDANIAELESLGAEFYYLTDEQAAEFREKGAEGVKTVEALVGNDEIIQLYKDCVAANK